jgi:glycosyltransferase involved in cell wall biosynthesis
VIYNGVDCGVFRADGDADESESPILLWVGRSHDPDKDFPGFATVAALLARKGWKIWIVDGCAQGDFNTLRAGLGDSCRISRGLSSSELAFVYRSVARSGGCLLSTSAHEAFGLVILEAMACGCPVVAPQVGGIPEIITDGETGLTYARVGAADAALEKVDVLADTSVRDTFVANALARAQSSFNNELMVSSYERLYKETMLSAGKDRCAWRRRFALAYLAMRKVLRFGAK